MKLRLLAVSVGKPAILGLLHGEPVMSGFRKSPVARDAVVVTSENIEGDGQADLSVHGGPDKAVYCYSADHWPWWEREKSLPCRPATFGENLTVEGCDETDVAIGDRFRWGDVILEVSQPRAPCFKFAMSTGRQDAPGLMTSSGRTGWYYRVIRGGQAPVTSGVLIRDARGEGPSVRDTFFAAMDPKTPAESLRKLAESAGLAESWRHALVRRLG